MKSEAAADYPRAAQEGAFEGQNISSHPHHASALSKLPQAS